MSQKEKPKYEEMGSTKDDIKARRKIRRHTGRGPAAPSEKAQKRKQRGR